jgi:hypothetical protein
MGWWSAVKLRAKAAEQSERFTNHLKFPQASVAEAQQAHRLMRAVFEDGFLAATRAEALPAALARFLAKVHEKFPPDAPDDLVRKGDANLSQAFRLGYEAGQKVLRS